MDQYGNRYDSPSNPEYQAVYQNPANYNPNIRNVPPLKPKPKVIAPLSDGSVVAVAPSPLYPPIKKRFVPNASINPDVNKRQPVVFDPSRASRKQKKEKVAPNVTSTQPTMLTYEEAEYIATALALARPLFIRCAAVMGSELMEAEAKCPTDRRKKHLVFFKDIPPPLVTLGRSVASHKIPEELKSYPGYNGLAGHLTMIGVLPYEVFDMAKSKRNVEHCLDVIMPVFGTVMKYLADIMRRPGNRNLSGMHPLFINGVEWESGKGRILKTIKDEWIAFARNHWDRYQDFLMQQLAKVPQGNDMVPFRMKTEEEIAFSRENSRISGYVADCRRVQENSEIVSQQKDVVDPSGYKRFVPASDEFEIHEAGPSRRRRIDNGPPEEAIVQELKKTRTPVLGREYIENPKVVAPFRMAAIPSAEDPNAYSADYKLVPAGPAFKPPSFSPTVFFNRNSSEANQTKQNPYGGGSRFFTQQPPQRRFFPDPEPVAREVETAQTVDYEYADSASAPAEPSYPYSGAEMSWDPQEDPYSPEQEFEGRVSDPETIRQARELAEQLVDVGPAILGAGNMSGDPTTPWSRRQNSNQDETERKLLAKAIVDRLLEIAPQLNESDLTTTGIYGNMTSSPRTVETGRSPRKPGSSNFDKSTINQAREVPVSSATLRQADRPTAIQQQWDSYSSMRSEDAHPVPAQISSYGQAPTINNTGSNQTENAFSQEEPVHPRIVNRDHRGHRGRESEAEADSSSGNNTAPMATPPPPQRAPPPPPIQAEASTLAKEEISTVVEQPPPPPPPPEVLTNEKEEGHHMPVPTQTPSQPQTTLSANASQGLNNSGSNDAPHPYSRTVESDHQRSENPSSEGSLAPANDQSQSPAVNPYYRRPDNAEPFGSYGSQQTDVNWSSDPGMSFGTPSSGAGVGYAQFMNQHQGYDSEFDKAISREWSDRRPGPPVNWGGGPMHQGSGFPPKPRQFPGFPAPHPQSRSSMFFRGEVPNPRERPPPPHIHGQYQRRPPPPGPQFFRS